jgi:hypothetical protein
VKEDDLDGQRAGMEETLNTHYFCGKISSENNFNPKYTFQDISILDKHDSSCIKLAQNRVQLRSSRNTAMNMSVTGKQLFS